MKSKKSVYEYVKYDSVVEKNFAEELEESELVKVYVKMPDWFKIKTPLGTYNPDWAVYIKKNTDEKLYFVFETKGTLIKSDKREVENGKIDCGKKHFVAVDDNKKELNFEVAVTFNEFTNNI